MSGNEIVINYSKVKFVSIFFFFFFFSFLLILFVYFQNKVINFGAVISMELKTTMEMHFDEPTRASSAFLSFEIIL